VKQHDVIVRAFGGEPLKRVAIGHGRGTVRIANPEFLAAVARGWSAPIGFPESDVFLYDSEAWDRLSGQWAATHEISSEEWGHLVPYSQTAAVSRETP
jgi:hypothetical protein